MLNLAAFCTFHTERMICLDNAKKAEQAHVDQVKEVITRQLALNEHEYQKAQLETSRSEEHTSELQSQR